MRESSPTRSTFYTNIQEVRASFGCQEVVQCDCNWLPDSRALRQPLVRQSFCQKVPRFDTRAPKDLVRGVPRAKEGTRAQGCADEARNVGTRACSKHARWFSERCWASRFSPLLAGAVRQVAAAAPGMAVAALVMVARPHARASISRPASSIAAAAVILVEVPRVLPAFANSSS